MKAMSRFWEQVNLVVSRQLAAPHLALDETNPGRWRVDIAARNELQKDFLSWTGGFPPETEEQIAIYADFSMPQQFDENEGRSFLREWICAEGFAYPG